MIYHHTLLKKSGGATGVALLIKEELDKAGIEQIHSYELSEDGSEKISPAKAAAKIPHGATVHLHSSANPYEFLSSLPQDVRKIVTLHDVQWFTGGCAYPLNCPHFELGCKSPCPRDYVNSYDVRAKRKELLLSSDTEFISPSGWLKRVALNAIPSLKIKVVPNGVKWPEKLANKSKLREELKIPQDSKVVLFIAHGGEGAGYKAGSSWRDYWSEISKRVPNSIAFAIGGSVGSQQDNFITLPYLDKSTLYKFLGSADVLAYPTLADNHPLIILEAMANGLPVVSYNIGGIKEQIVSGTNGILVEYLNNVSFVNEIVSLLNNKRLINDLGKRAYEYGKIKFVSQRMAKDYLKVYKCKS